MAKIWSRAWISLPKRYTSTRTAARAFAYRLVAIAEHLAVTADYLVVAAKRFYSPITLFSILTVGVALGSRRRADEVVGALAREKVIAGAVAAGAVSLL